MAPESILNGIIIALGFALVVWFILGMQTNINRGTRVARWMQGGLKLIGDRASMQWLGSSALRLGIREAKPPFQEVDIILLLEPRDVLPLWAYTRWRGRRDMLVIKGRLRQNPYHEFDVLDLMSWSGREAVARDVPPGWKKSSLSPTAMTLLTYSPNELKPMAQPALDLLLRSTPAVWRMSVRRTVPHLELHLALPLLAEVSSQQVFQAIREVATTVSAR
jgi:hypothetical protein